MNNKLDKPVWGGISFHFLTTIDQHESKQSLQSMFKFQYVRGDIHIHIATQNIILTFFCQSGTFPGSVNMEVSPNIWKRNTFQTINLYALRVHRMRQRRKLYNRIYFTVKLKLRSS